jgi:hypothetical protein
MSEWDDFRSGGDVSEEVRMLRELHEKGSASIAEESTMNLDREQAIKDVAAATECSVDGILECLNSPSDGTGYLLLEDSATIYAVSQRERVIALERAQSRFPQHTGSEQK